MENQQKVITFGALGEYDNLRPQVKPVKATYQQMTEMRELGKLIPGQLYRITDYVTTVNGATITNARSAGHPFDIIVMALTADTLSEDALAVRHEGDTYFKDARPEAWQLKYLLDNVQWSKQAGTYVTDEDNGYTFLVIGDITLSGHTYKLLQGFGMYVEDWSDYALMETVAEGEQIICYYGDPEDFDPEEPEVVGTASGVDVVTEGGKGTITWMKDEHGNEAGYDFKNIQQKRWKVTDELGRSSINGKYLGVLNNLPEKLSIEDESDFIWAYLYSVYNYAGGTQDTTDHSLTGKVHEMVTNFTVDSNNAFVWGEDYYEAYKCTFSGNVGNCSFSGYVNQNTFSGDVRSNSFSGDLINNSFSGDVQRNSFSGNLQNSIISGQLNNLQINASSGASGIINGLYTLGKIDGKTITVPTNAAYPTYAAMTTAGQLKTWNPAD